MTLKNCLIIKDTTSTVEGFVSVEDVSSRGCKGTLDGDGNLLVSYKDFNRMMRIRLAEAVKEVF